MAQQLVQAFKMWYFPPTTPYSNNLLLHYSEQKILLCSMTNIKFQSLLFFIKLPSSSSHLPTLPSLWSVLGSAMMAWTATMASLILVWSSLSSSICSRRRIWAASFRVASEKTFILGTNWELCFVKKHSRETHLQCQNPTHACPKLPGHPGKHRYMYNFKMYITWRIIN